MKYAFKSVDDMLRAFKIADLARGTLPKDGEHIVDICGSTASVLYVDESQKEMFVANVGDSRIIMSENGKSEVLTYDHKPEGKSEIKRVYDADGFIINGRVYG